MQSAGQRGSPHDPFMVGSIGNTNRNDVGVNLQHFNNSKRSSPHEGSLPWGSPILEEGTSSARSDGASTTAATSPSGFGTTDDEYERSSAPPPPGFASDNHNRINSEQQQQQQQHHRAANELLLWGQPTGSPSYTASGNGNGNVNATNNANSINTPRTSFLQNGISNLVVRDDFALGNPSYQRTDLLTNHNLNQGGSGSGTVQVPVGGGGSHIGQSSGTGNSIIDDRVSVSSSSFSNLAAMIGSGLAQSMEDSTQERTLTNDDALSYQRMARHAANRLVGAGASPTIYNTDLHLQHTVNHQYSANKQSPLSLMASQHHNQHHLQQTQHGTVAQQLQNQHQQRTQMNALDIRQHHHNQQQSQHQQQQQQPHFSASSNSPSYTSVSSPGHASFAERRASNGGQLRQFDSSNSLQSTTATANAGKSQSDNHNTFHRSSSPVQMFPGQSQRRNIPAKDIGMNVIEPDGDTNQFKSASGIVSRRVDTNHLNTPRTSGNSFANSSNTDFSNHHTSNSSNEKSTENVWRPEAPEFRPAGETQLQPTTSYPPVNAPASSNSSVSDSQANTEITARTAEIELRPYLWDPDRKKPSRTIAILRCSYLRAPDVRAACDRYGQLESFRADFSSKGIFFVAYYDIRSAQYASRELQPNLQRLSVMQGSSEEVLVQYCIPLNASSPSDESQILISDLPAEIDEYTLKSMLSTYGALRSVANQGEGYFVIEFQSSQDARQALLEIDSSQPWGPHVTVEVGLRNPIERKKGRELLAIIGRWRHGMSRQGCGAVDHRQFGSGNGGRQALADASWQPPTTNDPSQGRGIDSSNQPGTTTTQFILGPDGRYAPVFVQSATGTGTGFPQFTPANATTFDPRHQQLIQGPNGQFFIASTLPATQLNHHTSDCSSQVFIPQSSSIHHSVQSPVTVATSSGSRVVQATTPYYTHVVTSGESISISGRSHRSGQSMNDEKDSRHLQLDPDIVEIGNDTRTSLMVRNIPNKYTQQMLLNEFEENGHGPGVIDFFYLPIDFKNRCNRGYAFINFVNYKDIVSFHRKYFGKHWRTFNSDKICDITYARIQGKQAMLKRFENSALMEKDEEYKPLVFVSDGPDKGTRLPFPDPSVVLHSSTRAAI